MHFLGSNDYNWVHRGRVFPYQEGDKGSKESIGAKNLNKMYKLGKGQKIHAMYSVILILFNYSQTTYCANDVIMSVVKCCMILTSAF